jgi:chromosome segregation ATPase
MANSDMGLRIGVEGETAFKRSLQDINQNFKILGSEMTLVTSNFDRNERSIGSLTSRNEVLNKEIDEQHNKLELLRRALQNSAESFGENDRRTQNWQIQLNRAEAELNNMEREVSENETAISDMTDGTEDLGEELEETANTAEKSGGKFEKLGGILKGVGVAMGAIVVAAAAAGLSSSERKL